MKPDDVARVAGYELRLDGLTQRQGPNFRDMLAQSPSAAMAKDQRDDAVKAQFYDTRRLDDGGSPADPRREPALYLGSRHLGRRRHCGTDLYKPLVLLIWWGPVLMPLAGMLSLSDRPLCGRCTEAGQGCTRVAGRRMMWSRSLVAGVVAAVLASARRPLMPCCPTRSWLIQREARARELSRELRCMVCQNQSIDDSEARWRAISACWWRTLAAGDSDPQVLELPGAR